ncbi:MAG: L-glyceraldehyde 3-phosphate reductase [Candidatus Ancillula sp.]|nr:L-glyceraldehyde 3-phosphate reductase [Candidatus Ancillula sp.]
MDYIYQANPERYANMQYRRCGDWGLKLPAISLGLWHNFGSEDKLENGRNMLHTAFDLGITHFDLANNYGPVYGSAEENFGTIFEKDFKRHRDELILSTKAGYDMWAGPYGDGGSKKYLTASLDQSLKRMKQDYVDIFYSHRLDPETPLWETMEALALAVKSGKALYVGISSYSPVATREAFNIAKEMGIRLMIHQPNYSMFDRWVEDKPTGHGLLPVLEELGMGAICFAPLSQGLLTNKYLNGVPEDSRAAKNSGFLSRGSVTPERVKAAQELNEVAKNRNQSLSEMALAWILRDRRVTSCLIGASRPEQIIDNVHALDNLHFEQDELDKIDEILSNHDLGESSPKVQAHPWHKSADDDNPKL